MLNRSFSIPACGRERCRMGFWPQACWVSGAVLSSVIQTWSEMLSSRRWLHSTRRISSALGSMLTQNKQAACPEADKWMQRASPSSWLQGNPPELNHSTTVPRKFTLSGSEGEVGAHPRRWVCENAMDSADVTEESRKYWFLFCKLTITWWAHIF